MFDVTSCSLLKSIVKFEWLVLQWMCPFVNTFFDTFPKLFIAVFSSRWVTFRFSREKRLLCLFVFTIPKGNCLFLFLHWLSFFVLHTIYQLNLLRRRFSTVSQGMTLSVTSYHPSFKSLTALRLPRVLVFILIHFFPQNLLPKDSRILLNFQECC